MHGFGLWVKAAARGRDMPRLNTTAAALQTQSGDMLYSMGPVTVMHVDEHLIVTDKPAGLLAVPGRGEAGRDNLATRVQALYADALVVHRLDMATSGLLLFARGAAVQRQLSQAFAHRLVHKVYVAIVEGLLLPDEGEINAPPD